MLLWSTVISFERIMKEWKYSTLLMNNSFTGSLGPWQHCWRYYHVQRLCLRLQYLPPSSAVSFFSLSEYCIHKKYYTLGSHVVFSLCSLIPCIFCYFVRVMCLIKLWNTALELMFIFKEWIRKEWIRILENKGISYQ